MAARKFEESGTGQRFEISEADGGWAASIFTPGPEPYETMAWFPSEDEAVKFLTSQGYRELS